MPLLIAVLLALQDPDALRGFLDGEDSASSRARERLLKEGAAAMPRLLAARSKETGSRRYDALCDLIFEIKKGRAADPGDVDREIWTKLETLKLDISMSDARLEDVLGYLRDWAGLNLVVDPALAPPEKKLDVRFRDAALRTVLDTVVRTLDLDYDARFGCVFLSTVERLWKPHPAEPPAPLTDAQVRAARECIARLKSEAPEERDRASAELRKLGPAVAAILEEGAKSGDLETSARCKGLIDGLRRPAAPPGLLPAENAWRRQKADDENAACARKMRSMRLSIDMQGAPLNTVADYLRELIGLDVSLDAAIAGTIVTIKVSDLELGCALEVLTLPRGLDIRFDKGVIVVFAAKK